MSVLTREANKIILKVLHFLLLYIYIIINFPQRVFHLAALYMIRTDKHFRTEYEAGKFDLTS